MKLVATTAFGLEEVLAQEISAAGGTNIEQLNRAVSFEGDHKVLYAVNLNARTALRVLLPILSFKAHNETVLYKRLRRFDWSQYLSLDKTFVISSTVHSQIFTHSKYITYKVKDAICDQFRELHDGKRPSIEFEEADIHLNVHCNKNEFTISLDSSGQSLHKRGYRLSGAPAPLNEVLAAGMVLISGWDYEQLLLDPMCGTGTILLEAAMIANNIAPRKNWTHFAFMYWDDFSRGIWKEVKAEAIAGEKSRDLKIIGTDLDSSVLEYTRNAIKKIGMEGSIDVKRADFFNYNKPAEKGMIITNPPYGMRIGDGDMLDFYKEIGDQYKKEYSGWQAWLLSGNIAAVKNIGLRTSKKHTLYNGPVLCKFHRFDMYQGTRKVKKND